MKKLWHFIIEYHLFSLALLAAAAGLVLQLTHYSSALHWTLGVIALIEVLPLVWGMLQDLRNGTYGIDVLAATAIVSSVLLHEYWAGLVIVVMLTGGEALEDYAEHRAKKELDALLSRAPKKAHLFRKGQAIDVPIGQVKTNDKLILRAGEVVPVDALIIEGSATFDESSLTGESLPQAKTIGSQILSGSVNLDSVITIKALRPASESQYEQIIKLVKSASQSQTPFVRLADRYSVPFTTISFIIAIGAWVLSHQAIRFLDVLVVATPCPLILAAPIAVISGMSRAAKQGIIIKSGGALERLAEVRTIAFDKTGTLTFGNFAVDKIKTYSKLSQNEVLAIAAALEQNSNHVLAKSIVDKAKGQHLKLAKVRRIKELSGQGLSGEINGKAAIIGRLQLLQEQGVKLPKAFKLGELKQTNTLVAIDGSLVGAIGFRDELRPESKQVVKRLKSFGIKHILMITGDNQITAKEVARKVGIKEFYSSALPADKLHAIEQIKDRPVAFIGDGINDAPVLMAADVGIALGARGETAASESADMVIMQDDLTRVSAAVSIAHRTFSVARQSILAGIAMSVILMFIFASGHFRPIYGAVLQEGVDVTVIFNALRAHVNGRSKLA